MPQMKAGKNSGNIADLAVLSISCSHDCSRKYIYEVKAILTIGSENSLNIRLSTSFWNIPLKGLSFVAISIISYDFENITHGMLDSDHVNLSAISLCQINK